MLLQRRIYQLVIMSLLPVLALQVFSGIAADQQRTREVHSETLLHAKAVAQDISGILEAAKLAMLAFGELTRARGIANCGEFLKVFQNQYPAVTGFSLIDRSGVMQCATVPVAAGLNFSDWPPFREARESGSFVVSTFIIGRISKKQVVPLVLPLKDKDGAFNGVVSTSLDLDWFDKHLAEQALPEEAALAVVDRTGTVLVRLPHVPGAVGKPQPVQFKSLLKATSAGTTEAEARGVYRIIGYVPLNEDPKGLLVFVGIDKNAALAPVRHAAIRDVMLILAAFALSLLVAGYFGRQFIRKPLQILAGVINRWRMGETSARATNVSERSEIGRLAGSFNVLADQLVSRSNELQSSLQHQKSLVGEVNHRVKNTLAIVQAVAMQSFGEKRSVEEVKAVFTERLQALAEAHNMLSKVEWSGIELHELATAITAPYRDEDDDPFAISGSAIRLSPSIAVTTAMVLHELCTNAVKYGSLSREGGRVELQWKVEATEFSLSWKEVGGPQVMPPERASFGTRFIRSAFRHEDGSVSYEFLPGGIILVVRSALQNWVSQEPDHGLPA